MYRTVKTPKLSQSQVKKCKSLKIIFNIHKLIYTNREPDIEGGRGKGGRGGEKKRRDVERRGRGKIKRGGMLREVGGGDLWDY